jgi:hypothetical protein
MTPRIRPPGSGKVERFHQSLRRELLDDHPPFTSITDAQAAIAAFRHEYNTDRPHQSLDIAFPADRFRAEPGNGIPLKLPPSLATTIDETPAPPRTAPPRPLVAAPTSLAVEVVRTVPASGNLSVRGQQFWLGPRISCWRIRRRTGRSGVELRDP